MLVLTFLHDRWYVSWLVLTVSGGACNVSSIQYTLYTIQHVSPAVSSQHTPVCRVWSVLSLPRATATPMHHSAAARWPPRKNEFSWLPRAVRLGGVQGGGVVLSVTTVTIAVNAGTMWRHELFNAD